MLDGSLEFALKVTLNCCQAHTRPGEPPVVRIFSPERQAIVRDYTDCVCEFFELSRCRVSRAGALLGCQLFNLAPRSKAALAFSGAFLRVSQLRSLCHNARYSLQVYTQADGVVPGCLRPR